MYSNNHYTIEMVVNLVQVQMIKQKNLLDHKRFIYVKKLA